MEFYKYKKVFGIPIKKEKYTKWIEIPYSLYSPDLYSCFYPINMVERKNLDKKFYFSVNLKMLNTEEKWNKFFDEILKKHANILNISK